MSIDRLQDKIRKLKSPFFLELAPELLEAGDIPGRGRALLEGLKAHVPGVRFRFGSFALLGSQGLEWLKELLAFAKNQGYYVLLDSPELLSVSAAGFAAKTIFEAGEYPCDGLVIPGYLGSDIWKEFLPWCEKGDKDLFVVVRTGNKSAPELQDLITGSRLVHAAAADLVNRNTGSAMGKRGYSRLAVAAGASSYESLKTIRAKYPRLFILTEGLDYSAGNLKNCSAAFDKMGYGSAICAGSDLTNPEGEDPIAAAQARADQLKKNIGRYVTIL